MFVPMTQNPIPWYVHNRNMPPQSCQDRIFSVEVSATTPTRNYPDAHTDSRIHWILWSSEKTQSITTCIIWMNLKTMLSKRSQTQNIRYDSIVQKYVKLMVPLEVDWPYFWPAVTRRGKSGFWKLVMSSFLIWLLVTQGWCSVSRLVPSSLVFSWHGDHGFAKAGWQLLL